MTNDTARAWQRWREVEDAEVLEQQAAADRHWRARYQQMAADRGWRQWRDDSDDWQRRLYDAADPYSDGGAF